MQRLSYLFLILFILGLLVMAEWYRNKRILKKYEVLLLILMSMGVMGSASEYFALKWSIWSFSVTKSLNLRFGAELETYLYGVLAILLIAMITIVHATLLDRGSRKRRKLGTRRLARAAVATRR